MSQQHRIAIIFFSRSVTSESRSKRLVSYQRSNQLLTGALIDQTKSMLEKLELPVFHFSEANQVGCSFGERLANAYQTVYDLGFEGVISIGNDAPGLLEMDFAPVINQLLAGHCVIGPTKRKGAYLIGLPRSSFDYQQFVKLPWQKRQLLEALSNYCTSATTFLPELRDLNTLHDLREIVGEHTGWLYKLLKIILRNQSVNDRIHLSINALIAPSSRSLRAPPLC